MSNETTQQTGGVWDEEIGKPENSPLFNPEEAAAVAANVKEAESLTWAELKARAEGCPA